MNKTNSWNKPYHWYWPPVDTLANAKRASNQGFWAAVVIAALTALVATLATFQGGTIAGINAFAYIDAALFAIIAWRIRMRSKVFSVIGLAIFFAEKVYQFATYPPRAMHGGIIAVILLLMFINGVRGTFAYHQLKNAQTPP